MFLKNCLYVTRDRYNILLIEKRINRILLVLDYMVILEPDNSLTIAKDRHYGSSNRTISKATFLEEYSSLILD